MKRLSFMVAYFLCNNCAKNYQNRFMCVKVVARQSSDIFFSDTVYNTTGLQETCAWTRHGDGHGDGR